MAHVWLSKSHWQGNYWLNDALVSSITPLLTAQGRISGNPNRLDANANKCFIGSLVLGMGFILEPDEAFALIEADPINRDCLFPYLNGEDSNSRPDQSPSRWVINFRDWPLSRGEKKSWYNATEEDKKNGLARVLFLLIILFQWRVIFQNC